MTHRHDDLEPARRHGWSDPDKIFTQIEYKHLPWGFGGKTWAEWGCPALALIPLVRLAGIKAGETPESAQDRLRRASPPVWLPGKSEAYLPALARVLGFQCPDHTKAWDIREKKGGMTAREMSIAICDAIDHLGHPGQLGFAWVHLDYDGDEVGNHWGGAFAYDDRWIYVVDSVPGRVIRIDRKTLTAKDVPWGSRLKRYRIVRGYPLTV